MATIKSYTSVQQSRKLAEILPPESADMHYVLIDTVKDKYSAGLGKYIGILPHRSAWSLVALLGVLPKIGAEEPMVRKLYYANEPKERYICEYSLTNMTSEYDNPVDACVAMIERLHELNLL